MSAVGMIVGTLATLAFSAYGMYRQEQQNKDIRAESTRRESRDNARSELDRSRSLSMNREALNYQRRESDREWRWREEEQDYQRSKEAIDRFTNFMDRSPLASRNLINVWSASAARNRRI